MEGLVDQTKRGSGAPIFSIAKILEAHPDRFELIRENPNMTKEDAVKRMKEHNRKTKAAAKTAAAYKRDRITRHLDEIEAAAATLTEFKLQLSTPANNRLLLEMVTPRLRRWIEIVATGLDDGNRSLELIENLERRISEDGNQAEAVEDEASASLPHYRAAAAALQLEPGRLRTAADGEADGAAADEAADDDDDDNADGKTEQGYADAAA